ncbi:MAG: transposase [Mycobacterium sp.]|uniref:transposase n=1 Tax=Mycobacterium sp. TaxID=1785 RepID=UPI003F9A5D14
MPIAQVARDLDINASMLGNWVAEDSAEREGTQGLSTDDVAELNRLRTKVADLRMERGRLKPFGGPVGERGTEVSVAPKPVVRHHNQSTLRDFWREGYPNGYWGADGSGPC